MSFKFLFTISVCTSVQRLITLKTTTFTHSVVRHNTGVKGSCQPCKIKVTKRPQDEVLPHAVNNIWTGPIRKPNPLWTFLFWNCPYQKDWTPMSWMKRRDKRRLVTWKATHWWISSRLGFTSIRIWTLFRQSGGDIKQQYGSWPSSNACCSTGTDIRITVILQWELLRCSRQHFSLLSSQSSPHCNICRERHP